MKIDNRSNINFIGNELLKEVYKRGYNLEASEIIIHKAKYNKYANVSLFCEDGCIDWSYNVSI